jgi:hypothetical protein
MLCRLSSPWILSPLVAMALSAAGCGGGNFESGSDPYGGIDGGQAEINDVEEDLKRQQEAARGG